MVRVASSTGQAKEALASFGPAVTVEAAIPAILDTCNPQSCGPVARGGLQIDHTVTPVTSCTEGPMARRVSGSLVYLTAGHCFHFGGGATEPWKQSGVLTRTSSGDTWTEWASADSGYVTVDSGYLPGNDVKLLVTAVGSSGPDVVGFITQYYLHSGQLLHFVVCRTGAFSFHDDADYGHCGTIVNTDLLERSCKANPCPTACPSANCVHIDHQWVTDFDSKTGDSGGAYYTPPDSSNNVTLYGTHTHSTVDFMTPAQSWYSPVDFVIAAINSALSNDLDYFCTSPTCVRPTCFFNVCS